MKSVTYVCFNLLSLNKSQNSHHISCSCNLISAKDCLRKLRCNINPSLESRVPCYHVCSRIFIFICWIKQSRLSDPPGEQLNRRLQTLRFVNIIRCFVDVCKVYCGDTRFECLFSHQSHFITSRKIWRVKKIIIIYVVICVSNFPRGLFCSAP